MIDNIFVKTFHSTADAQQFIINKYAQGYELVGPVTIAVGGGTVFCVTMIKKSGEK